MLSDLSKGLVPNIHLDTELLNDFELWVYHRSAAADVLDRSPRLEALIRGVKANDAQAIAAAAFVSMDRDES